MFNFKTRYFRTQGDQNAVIYVCILKDINKDNLLNKRSEIFGKCHQKTGFE